MSRDFEGKVALVAGGTRGVGRATCLELASRGADVALLYRREEETARALVEALEAAGVRALSIRADVADGPAVDAATARVIAELGQVDVMVFAAGSMVQWAPVRELTVEAWSRFIDVDLNGGFHAIHAVLGHMHERGDGVIVAISSIAAQMCQARNSQGAAAKAGLEALIRVVAREEGRHGIRANVVSIGLTDTDQARAAFDQWGPGLSDRIVAGIPLQRIARPEEVARMVAYLASEDGAYITGKVIQVDGGQLISG